MLGGAVWGFSLVLKGAALNLGFNHKVRPFLAFQKKTLGNYQVPLTQRELELQTLFSQHQAATEISSSPISLFLLSLKHPSAYAVSSCQIFEENSK